MIRTRLFHKNCLKLIFNPNPSKNSSTSVNLKGETFEEEFNANYIETSLLQNAILSVGSALVLTYDPRADLVACLGETTGESALVYMKERMLSTTEGTDIFNEKPRINSKTVDFKRLGTLPEGTIGKMYHDFLVENNVTADSRLPVRFVKDIELAYVMQRYREVHDLVHSTLRLNTTRLGEVTIKWVEGLQTRLPMCVTGGIFGAFMLKPKHRKLYMDHYLPWAIKTGTGADFLQGVYFEKRWEQPLDEFYQEMNITPLEIPNKT